MRPQLSRCPRPGARRRALFALIALAAVGCAIDDRHVTVEGVEQLGENPQQSDGGTGDSPLVLSRSALDLGAATTGFAALGRVTLSNAGERPLALSGMSLVTAAVTDFQIVQNECGALLGAGASCDVRIQFVPAQLGARQNTLLIQPVQGAALRLPLQGRGLQPGTLALSPAMGASADFGAVLIGEYAFADFLISNPGTRASGALSFEVANPAFVPQTAGNGSCVTGQTQLAPGGSCAVRLAFAPEQRGPSEATLSATSVNLGSSSLALNGAGMLPGTLNLAPDRGDFPGVVLAGSGAETFAVRNLGDLPVTLGATSLQGEQAVYFRIASNGCRDGDQLSAGEQCNIDLEFRPTQVGTSAASLLLAVVGGQLSIPIQGQGLVAGTISVASEMASFGDVPLGERRVQRILVSNSDLKGSGALTLLSNGDFSVLAPSQAGDCQTGVTVLRGGEGCTANLQLAPTRRGIRHGTFTVVSELAGAASVPVDGRATLPGHIALSREEVNFGDVARATSASAQLAISNDGDLPLAPLALSLGAATRGNSGSFTFDRGCAAGLAPGASCTLGISFQPSASGVHSVTLALSSGNEVFSPVLLRGVGVEPGNLTLQASTMGGTDFGDVAVNTSLQRQFSISNPGGAASGALSITSSNNRFVVSDVSCAALGAAGLAAGRSCDIRVGFTPVSSDAQTANLQVSSVAAGRAALSLSGRGRRPPALQGALAIEFGLTEVGLATLTQRWTLTNAGDLPTGVLSTTGVGTEFPISADTCNGFALAAGAQCSMQIGFVPLAAGQRVARIRVSSSGTLVQAEVQVSGTGQVLPAIGEACPDGVCQVRASCETSSNGSSRVCCASDCTGTARCTADFLNCEQPNLTPTLACAEATVCPQAVGCVGSVPFESTWDSTGLLDLHTSSCNGSVAPEFALVFLVPFSATYRFEASGSTDSLLAIGDGACVNVELACNDDLDTTGNRDSRIDLALSAGQVVTIYVSEFGDGAVGQGTVRVTSL